MKQGNEGDDQPRITICKERESLTDVFLRAIRELAELQKQQTEAVIQHDADFTRFDDLIHMARLAKDNAKYALLAHISEHGCHQSRHQEEKEECNP